MIESGELVDAVVVRVLPGPDNGSAGRADGVGDEGIREAHTFVGEAVKVWRGSDFGQTSAISADRVGRVIVRHYVEDIWPLFACG